MDNFGNTTIEQFAKSFYGIFTAHTRLFSVLSGAQTDRGDGSTITIDRGAAIVELIVKIIGNTSNQNCLSDEFWEAGRVQYESSENPDFRRFMQNLSTSVRLISPVSPQEFMTYLMRSYVASGQQINPPHKTKTDALERLPTAATWVQSLDPNYDHWFLCLVFIALTPQWFQELDSLHLAILASREAKKKR